MLNPLWQGRKGSVVGQNGSMFPRLLCRALIWLSFAPIWLSLATAAVKEVRVTGRGDVEQGKAFGPAGP